MECDEQDTGGAFPDDTWKASKFCGPNGGNCVEVNLGRWGVVGVRDSKAGAGPVLAFGPSGWGRFVWATKGGGLV